MVYSEAMKIVSRNFEIPLVSVPVYTYNSAKTVIETLESIKAQTYPNIELIISDDCSTDDTVDLCRNWIEKNKARFVRTEIIVPEHNTGISANCNRGEAVCAGEWIKGIAGDDLLMPNCIQDCMDYVAEHPETVALFGRVRSFGGTEEENKAMDDKFDYYLLSWTKEQLLHRLIFEGNGLPAPGFFYHRSLLDKKYIVSDERIPMLEDLPKWINLLRAGVQFHFLDKDIVQYRLSSGVSTGKRSSLKYFESERLYKFYYAYPEWLKIDLEEAVKRIVKEECDVYKQLLEAESDDANVIHKQRDEYQKLYERYYREYNQIVGSKAYKLGKILLKPINWFRK